MPPRVASDGPGTRASACQPPARPHRQSRDHRQSPADAQLPPASALLQAPVRQPAASRSATVATAPAHQGVSLQLGKLQTADPIGTGSVNSPSFNPTKVTVRLALIATPSSQPVSAHSPDGISTATIGRPLYRPAGLPGHKVRARHPASRCSSSTSDQHTLQWRALTQAE